MCYNTVSLINVNWSTLIVFELSQVGRGSITPSQVIDLTSSVVVVMGGISITVEAIWVVVLDVVSVSLLLSFGFLD